MMIAASYGGETVAEVREQLFLYPGIRFCSMDIFWTCNRYFANTGPSGLMLQDLAWECATISTVLVPQGVARVVPLVCCTPS